MLVHGYPFMQMDEGFWCWGGVSKRAVGAFGVAMTPPSFNDDLGLFQRVEDFSVEQFVAQAGVEALDIAVFPR